MLQSPHGDGPPRLDFLEASRQITAEMRGPPIGFSTARVVVPADENDVTGAAQKCVKEAIDSLSKGANPIPALAHVTLAPDLPAYEAASGIFSALPNGTPVLGRTVSKEGAARTLEVLLLSAGEAFGVGVARADTSANATQAAALAAAEQTNRVGVFALFAASSNCDEKSVRAALDSAFGEGFPAYGGSAQGGNAWALLCDGGVTDADTAEDAPYVVAVALAAGSTSFLISAVIKNWAQPVYADKPKFLRPVYKNDPSEDLLIAIKFDDWDTFLSCFQEHGMDVNLKWTKKQNQSPLLAAAGRARTRMLQYLIDNGADVHYRNAGGFNAVMYTLRLREYGDDFVEGQLEMLRKAGADLDDTEVRIP